MHRNRSVDVHRFAMIPRADIPRSAFRMQKVKKDTFTNGGNGFGLVPFMVEEVLPGDTFNVRWTLFARLATPITPFMDNMYLETFYFFVPNRLVWDNWKKFMGEQLSPADSISYTIPQIVSPAGGYAIGSTADHMGLPTVGQVAAGQTVSHSALPYRALARIWNEWFRDENLMNGTTLNTGDGPDSNGGLNTEPFGRGKRHDYFTSCLPWTQKGGTAVSIPLGTSAPVNPVAGAFPTFKETTAGAQRGVLVGESPTRAMFTNTAVGSAGGQQPLQWDAPGLVADLSTATAATINQLRQSFQIQKLLERDARGGTRYTEIVRSHFGVISPDARLQRPEYLGGNSTAISVNPVAQTGATGTTGSTTPQGNLAAVGTGLSQSGFTQSFTEHGYIIGLLNVRADLTYQQGLRRHWSRLTRYDFYFPAFAMLGEQAVLSKEIFCDGTAGDNNVFGYQERWAEYRYNPSEISGLFRSTAAGTLDYWHLAQKFTTRPTLNGFIFDNPPTARVVAVPAQPHFLLDGFMDAKVARPMPMYSVPGMIDHF